MSITTQESLKDRWISFHQENPRVRIRDAAGQLGVSEAEILASFAGSSVLRLNNKFRELWQRMPELGFVMVLTRNESCVHERKGFFEKVSVGNSPVGTVVGEDIDLRMLFHCWSSAFAVFDNEEAALKRSIQVFDQQGVAIVKIYPQPNSNMEAFDAIVREFQEPVQDSSLTILPAPAAPVYADAQADLPAFLADWGALKDTHDFFPLLRKYNLSRQFAVQAAENTFSRKLSSNSVKTLLDFAAASQMQIMIFVGNHGMIQIHTGHVSKIVEIPGWINVMDPNFNLHLRLDHISECWAVTKPTADGPVHSLEIFDASGNMIVQFFGKRKPGSPELPEWIQFIRDVQ